MIRTAIHAAVWSTRPEATQLSRTLASAAEIGFDCLALPLRDPSIIVPADVARAFQTAGMSGIGTAGVPPDADPGAADSISRDRALRHLQETIAMARDCGMFQINGVIYGPLGRAAGPADDDTLRRSAETLHKAATAASAAGLRLCVELVNRYETALLNSVETGLRFLELVDHPNVLLHLDTYHLAIEEAEPVAAIRNALPQLGYFELDQSHRGRLDQGSLDLDRLSAPLRETGYSGIVGVEAFARSRLAPDHANALAIWRDHFDDGDSLARNAMAVIRRIFGPEATATAARTAEKGSL